MNRTRFGICCHHRLVIEEVSWWRHQMETFSALLAICAGNSTASGDFPTQRPVTRSFDVFFDLHPNKRLSKKPWGWWFETLLCPLWRHRNALIGRQAITLGITLATIWLVFTLIGVSVIRWNGEIMRLVCTAVDTYAKFYGNTYICSWGSTYLLSKWKTCIFYGLCKICFTKYAG